VTEFPAKSYAPAVLELTAQRTAPLPQCRCTLGPRDRCNRLVDNPDNPVCDSCQEAHWNEPEFRLADIEVRKEESHELEPGSVES